LGQFLLKIWQEMSVIPEAAIRQLSAAESIAENRESISPIRPTWKYGRHKMGNPISLSMDEARRNSFQTSRLWRPLWQAFLLITPIKATGYRISAINQAFFAFPLRHKFFCTKVIPTNQIE
jgi:hypothetical protein